MSPTSDITEGLAQALADAGVALYSHDGIYPLAPSLPVVTIKALPPTPDRVIALTPYLTTPRTDGHTTVGVQARVRATTFPTDVDDLTDAAAAALLGIEGVFGDTTITLTEVTSQAALPADANGRYEATVNVLVHYDRPGLTD